jgi:murein DD-endopeptidase MepM/ murein hydrolase activator NlpD
MRHLQSGGALSQVSARIGLQLAAFGLVTLLVPALALALPTAASVPGGVALIRLDRIGSAAPRAWFGDRPVLVTAESGYWVAVVGLALDLPPGSHELRVDAGSTQTNWPFAVGAKNYPAQHITLKDSGKVVLAAADEARAEKEIAAITALKRHWRAADDTDSDFLPPAAGRLASRFGLRRFFNGEARAPHAGLDVAVPRGTPVKAAAHGQVLAVGDYFFNGKTVFVDHGNGLISMYCHLDRIDVQAGDPVAKGRAIGRSGMTGRASGPHLHWSVILNGAMVDPELFLRPRKTD